MKTAAIALAAAALGLLVGSGVVRSSSNTAYQVPRTADGTPDLNGIWQAMNTANWDLEGHAASQGKVVALGAAFSVPGGMGVVDGDEIPYQEWAAGEEEGERGAVADARSRDQVLPARCAARHLHAVSVPDRADADQRPLRLRVRQRQPHRLHEQLRREPGRVVDGVLARPLGRRDAGRRRHRVQRGHLVRPRRQLPQRPICTSSSATRAPARTCCSTRPRSRIRRCSRDRGRSACRSTAASRRTRSCSSTSASSSSRS